MYMVISGSQKHRLGYGLDSTGSTTACILTIAHIRKQLKCTLSTHVHMHTPAQHYTSPIHTHTDTATVHKISTTFTSF